MVITQLATPNLSQIFRTAISYNIHSIKCELSPRLYVNLLRLLKLLLRLLTALVFYFYIKRFILAKITHEIKLGFIDLPLLHVLGCPFHLFITSHVIMFIFRIFQASLHHNGVFIYRRYACFSWLTDWGEPAWGEPAWVSPTWTSRFCAKHVNIVPHSAR